ncbi:hypothetical protein F966_02194 [Acinetobacter higginsii]|uniref:Uncharacterized protein n=1 Tax=Acinetobacter higginsii TaxID=70347 RepID=N8WCA5_9GAMM|nr:hypothetical protein [Acinetobacter higginsii]ENV09536.1 hypothetical protein F966_02194 [Acinetobacter higginsii]
MDDFDIQAEYEEFEQFMSEESNIKFDDSDVYKRKKYGKYFDKRDDYFQLWFATKVKYQKCSCK